MPLAFLPIAEVDDSVPAACRFRTHKAHLRQMAEIPVAGLPPVVVFQETRADGQNQFWLADGGYRLMAAQRQNRLTIRADVLPGNLSDAILHACQANERHGQPRSNVDKRACVVRLLGNPLFSARSDEWVAEQCHVSDTFVAKLRRQQGRSCGERLGRDGKVRRLPSAASESETPVPDPKSSRDVALEELARARAEIDAAISALRGTARDRTDPNWKILKKLRAARQEVLVWQESLERSPAEPPIPDPNDTSPAGLMAAEMYRVRRLEPAELLGYAKKVMSHDQEGMRKKGARDEGREMWGGWEDAWREGGGREGQPPTKRAERSRPPTKRADLQPPTKRADLQPPTKRADLQPPTKRAELRPPTKRAEIQPPTKRAELQPPIKPAEQSAPSAEDAPASSFLLPPPCGEGWGGGQQREKTLHEESTRQPPTKRPRAEPPKRSELPDLLAHRPVNVPQPPTKHAGHSPPVNDRRSGPAFASDPPEVSPFVGLLGYAPAQDSRAQPPTRRAEPPR